MSYPKKEKSLFEKYDIWVTNVINDNGFGCITINMNTNFYDDPIMNFFDELDELDELDQPDLEAAGFSTLPPKRPPGATPWTIADGPKPPEPASVTAAAEGPTLKLGIKTGGPQSELSLDAAPRGRFEGENPNVFEGEDLDLPPFLRKKKS